MWFSGPDSDVGGGYGDSLLGGTSVDWMIGRLEVLAAETSKPHDSRQNWAGVLTLRCCEADLHQRRLLAGQSEPFGRREGRLHCVHRSLEG